MNQWLAELFLSMPPALSDSLTFGSLMLVLCWLGYAFWLRAPLLRAVRARCGEAFLADHMPRPWHWLFCGTARKKARLDEGGLYIGNHAVFWSLLSVSVVHGVLFYLTKQGESVCGLVDRVILTVASLIIGALCLWTQPAATVERRVRWGFGRMNAVIHAIVWEALTVAVLFLWLYDAWFFPAFG